MLTTIHKQPQFFTTMHKEWHLSAHHPLQVQKAQIEKAEIKADMTKERLEVAQELMLERERSRNLDDTVRILKEQADLYQVLFKDFKHFVNIPDFSSQ